MIFKEMNKIFQGCGGGEALRGKAEDFIGLPQIYSSSLTIRPILCDVNM